MNPIRNLLVARDFSPCAERALQTALTLAVHAEATLHVVHAEVLHGDPYGKPSDPADAVDRLRERLKAGVERDRDDSVRFDPGSVRVEHAVIRDVAAAPALVRYAEEHAIDLIVMGTHGRTGVRRLLLGSVAEEVVRWAPCPVLTIRGGEEHGFDVASILVPYDFSPSSRAALGEAVRLGRLLGARLDLLHVGETTPTPAFYDVGVITLDYGEHFVEHALDQLRAAGRDALAEVPGAELEVRAHVGIGRTPGVIVEEAGRLGSDLIAMGTQGLSGVEHLLLGSVAERVLRTAPCPVVVAKSRADKARSRALARREGRGADAEA